MKLRQQNLQFESLEFRRLLTVAPLAHLASDYFASESQVVSDDVLAGHHDTHDHHVEEEGYGGIVLEGSDNTSAEWDAGTPDDITHVVTIQPILVSNDDGSNAAAYFGDATQQAIIEDLIDQVWSQAGIDVDWLTPNFWQSSAVNFGNGSPAVARPNSDLDWITDAGDAQGYGNDDPLVLDMYFVEISAGFRQLDNNYANGLAYVGGNGSTVHVGDELLDFPGGREVIARVVAHEIGHNLGLGHTSENANLMGNGERLNETQIQAALSSEFSTPAPAEPIVFLPGDTMLSDDGRFQMTFQVDGNLVVYEVSSGRALWHTRTHGMTVTSAVMQPDGNFVLYNGADAVWHTYTYGNDNARLVLSNSGELSIVSATSEVLWSSLNIDQLSPGESVISANGQYQLSLQTDGNLVVYNRQDGSAVWHTHTFGTAVTQAVMQVDGNFVLYNGTEAVWHSHTYGNAGAQLSLTDEGVLEVSSRSGQTIWSSAAITSLTPGESVVSPNGLFQLSLQTDGNLVVYERSTGQALWHTHTYGQPVTQAVMQTDGNFVLYNAGTAIWHSHTYGNSGAQLRLDGDGKLRIVSLTGLVLWSST